jgi:hypothetical protein
MKYGDILLFKPKGLIGKLISLADGSPYSHAGLFIGYFNKVPIFIESHEKRGGVVLIKLEEWSNFIVLRSESTPRPVRDVLQLLNTKYDYSRLFWILKAKLTNKSVTNNDESKLICSELVDYAYHYEFGKGKICTPATLARDSTLKRVHKWAQQ